MCREKCSQKCFMDNILLTLVIVLFMLICMYIASPNPGIIPIVIIISVLTFIIFSIRLEDYGCPNWIKNIGRICRDELTEEEEN
mgnify:FL=1